MTLLFWIVTILRGRAISSRVFAKSPTTVRYVSTHTSTRDP
jgi:hypothetical protein